MRTPRKTFQGTVPERQIDRRKEWTGLNNKWFWGRKDLFFEIGGAMKKQQERHRLPA